MAAKSKDAFRTISEVADWLDVPTHVLRFWESRFSQIKPVKRAGGRRYYRPSDMRIIGGVKVLLHDQGMTIRGVQKLFREEGVKHVSGFSPTLFDEDALADTSQPLDRDAIEKAAQPAPMARATRDAEPDPIPDDTQAPPEDTAPLFRHAETAQAEAPTASVDASAAPDEANTAERPTIPPTPDVPDTDPTDTDDAFKSGPSVAARLATRSKDDLLPHRETLQSAANRLKALLDKVS